MYFPPTTVCLSMAFEQLAFHSEVDLGLLGPGIELGVPP